MLWGKEKLEEVNGIRSLYGGRGEVLSKDFKEVIGLVKMLSEERVLGAEQLERSLMWEHAGKRKEANAWNGMIADSEEADKFRKLMWKGHISCSKDFGYHSE